MQSLSVMATRRSPGWLARSFIAGFIALAVSTVALVAASAIAGSIGEAFPRGANLLADWMYELTHNPVVELGRGSLFAAIALHLAVGMIFAVLYGLVFGPRLQHFPAWQSGVIFSMLPFFLSVVVFLPLTGGGLFGSELGAGPLPLIGNLLLHVIYGATLGAVYGSGADRTDEVAEEGEPDAVQQAATMGRAESSAARGILLGAILGGVAGVVLGFLLPPSEVERLIGSWPVALGVAGALAGGAVGALVGSMAGLTDPAVPTVDEEPTDGQPIAAALLPLGVILFVAFLIVSIGSALLTVGNTAHPPEGFGRDQGYNQAIFLGLGILTAVTAGAILIDRFGRRRSKDLH